MTTELVTTMGFLRPFLDPILAEVGAWTADRLRIWRVENVTIAAQKALGKLAKAGIDPKQVSPKFLLPWIEHASIEDNETLQEMWATLLANTSRSGIDNVKYISILKELSYEEAIILCLIYKTVPGNQIREVGVKKEKIIDHLKLPDEKFELLTDNLFRLNLCQGTSTRLGFIDDPEKKFALRDKNVIQLTKLGHAFITECTTMPTKVEEQK